MYHNKFWYAYPWGWIRKKFWFSLVPHITFTLNAPPFVMHSKLIDPPLDQVVLSNDRSVKYVSAQKDICSGVHSIVSSWDIKMKLYELVCPHVTYNICKEDENQVITFCVNEKNMSMWPAGTPCIPWRSQEINNISKENIVLETIYYLKRITINFGVGVGGKREKNPGPFSLVPNTGDLNTLPLNFSCVFLIISFFSI